MLLRAVIARLDVAVDGFGHSRRAAAPPRNHTPSPPSSRISYARPTSRISPPRRAEPASGVGRAHNIVAPTSLAGHRVHNVLDRD